MQIVIDIPNEKYKRLPYIDQFSLREYIENGTPLPKGHGRLIDASAYINRYSDCGQFDAISVHEFTRRTPTIIEADGGEENE